MKAENSNAFKHWINAALVKRMSEALKKANFRFDAGSFSKVAKKLEPLELKARVTLLREALHAHLPQDYKKAVNVLLQSLASDTLKGFDLWPYTEFVQTYGLKHPEVSLKALYLLTKKFTAEFAVRPFLVENPTETYKQLLQWTTDPSEHVRRWTSEGTRPRLPWGLRLHAAIENPGQGLKILEKLKYDDALYVRKSVANHLNDISKDHPELVVTTLEKWKQNCPQKHLSHVTWIQRHALRTLIKKGHQGALAQFGVMPKPKVQLQKLKLEKKKLQINDHLEFEVHLKSTGTKPQQLEIDYIIDFIKSNGKHGAKVYKLKKLSLDADEEIKIRKRHSLKKITTMKYYAGEHRVKIQLNGEVVAIQSWIFDL